MEIKPLFVLCAFVTILSLALLTEAKEYDIRRYSRHAPADKGSKSSSSEEHKGQHGEGHKAGVHHANGHSGKLEQKAFGNPIGVSDHGNEQNGGQKGSGFGGHGGQGGQIGQGGQHGNIGQKGPMNGHLAAPRGSQPGDHYGQHNDCGKGHHGR